MKKHGLSELLRCYRKWGKDALAPYCGSPILLISDKERRGFLGPPSWAKPVPSVHVLRLLVRAFVKEQAATFADWNALLDRVLGRMYPGRQGAAAIRRRLFRYEDGEIVAWGVTGGEIWPMSSRDAAGFSDDPGERKRAEQAKSAAEQAESERRAAISRWGRCDLCLEPKKTNKTRDALKGWRAEKNAQGGIRRGQPYSMSYGNYLCAECNAYVRQEVKIVDRAQRALDRLIAETRTLTKATKEYRNGPQ